MCMEESNMQIDQCQTVRKLLGRLPGVELREKKGAKLKFRVYVTQKMLFVVAMETVYLLRPRKRWQPMYYGFRVQIQPLLRRRMERL